MFRFPSRPAARLRWPLLAIVWLLPWLAQAQSQDLLPVTEAFKLQASLSAPGQVHLHWDIAPHYYLYRSHIHISTDGGLQLGPPSLPHGHQYHDPYLGEVETYHNQLDVEQPYSGSGPVRLTVQYQGCHEVEPKICYPPHTETVNLGGPPQAATPPQAPPPAAVAAPAADLSQLGLAANDRQPLPVGQAFQLSAQASAPDQLRLRWQMPPGYYLYKNQIQVHLAAGQPGQLQPLHWPSGMAHHDAYQGDSIVYFDSLELPLTVRQLPAGTAQLRLEVRYQGCLQNGICYPPVQITLPLALAPGPVPASSAAAARSPSPAATVADPAPRLSPWLLLSALLGGLLLNLLPCVLPVLSLKVLGILDNAHQRQALRRHALGYAAGVLLSFIAIDLLAHGFGQSLGAQLQQPLLVAILATLMVAVGLSLSGVVEFSSRFTSMGQSLASRRGWVGDFFTGVLAVVVASPCTGPLMGPPVAYALTAPLASSLAVFVALGLGLALPVLLIAAFPVLVRALPRPGRWMETLKQWLAFPMYLSAVWLSWVLGKQRGSDAIALLLVAIVALAMSLWWLQRSRHKAPALRLLLLPMLLAMLLPLLQIGRLPPPQAAPVSTTAPLAYSPQALARLRAAGTPVLVDMGADWCVTCQANEHTVLDSADFRHWLQQSGAVYMKGDWTDVNPTIAAFLKHYHSPGVPLYVMFPRHGGEGEVLPTVLTPAVVKAALQRAAD